MKKQVKRLQNLYDKMLRKGISSKEANLFDKKTWNKTFNVKVKTNASLNAQKRLLNQIYEKKKEVFSYHVKKSDITSKKYKNFIKKQANKLFTKIEKEIEIGKYKITKIRIGKKTYWIKYIFEEDFMRQLNIIRANYSFKTLKIKKIFTKTVKYKEFVNLERFATFVNA